MTTTDIPQMEPAWRALSDPLGPTHVGLVRDPALGLEAIVVVDNTACGPAIGGIRMAPDVTVHEVARLARAMSFKNALAGLAHGGGKAGIVADPAMDAGRKERLVRAFGRAIGDLRSYIPGPDMGTDETCMAWLHDEMGRAVGLPRVVGGIPLDEIGATGLGLAVAAEVAEALGVIRVRGARVAIQGFGAVGRHAARFLVERGAVVVAVADSGGAVGNPAGLDLAALAASKAAGQSVRKLAGARALSPAELLAVDCDVWIPAARPDVIDADGARAMRAKLVLQGANIPATADAERILHERGIVSVPDFVANAGGVICAAVEYHGGTQTQALATIEDLIRENVRAVLEEARRRGVLPRVAANDIARARIEAADRLRRH